MPAIRCLITPQFLRAALRIRRSGISAAQQIVSYGIDPTQTLDTLLSSTSATETRASERQLPHTARSVRAVQNDARPILPATRIVRYR